MLLQLFKVETFSDFWSQCQNLSHTDQPESSVFIKRLASWLLPRIAQYDLVQSMKNTNTEACSDDLIIRQIIIFHF